MRDVKFIIIYYPPYDQEFNKENSEKRIECTESLKQLFHAYSSRESQKSEKNACKHFQLIDELVLLIKVTSNL